jgi:hypothetical protein
LATLTVTLSAYSGLTVTVDVAVVGGTADGGIDYIPPVTSLTFAPGTNTQIFQIAVTDDSDVEPTESVILMLSNPQGATLLDAHDRATLTIADDDGTVMYIAILMR